MKNTVNLPAISAPIIWNLGSGLWTKRLHFSLTDTHRIGSKPFYSLFFVFRPGFTIRTPWIGTWCHCPPWTWQCKIRQSATRTLPVADIKGAGWHTQALRNLHKCLTSMSPVFPFIVDFILFRTLVTTSIAPSLVTRGEPNIHPMMYTNFIILMCCVLAFAEYLLNTWSTSLFLWHERCCHLTS